MKTGAFSQSVGKFFLELKLVTGNLHFIYTATNWEAPLTECWNVPCFNFLFLSLNPIYLLGIGRMTAGFPSDFLQSEGNEKPMFEAV